MPHSSFKIGCDIDFLIYSFSGEIDIYPCTIVEVIE